MSELAQRRIKITLEFDGRPFEGWQRQERGRTIQSEVEKALESALGDPVTVQSAGRTDAGVHARAMVAHFDVAHPIPADRIARATQGHLPREISILDAEEAAPDFDARRDALLRWYRYQIAAGGPERPLGPRAWRVHEPMDVDRMAEGLERMKGEHDFAGFRSSACSARRTVLTMKEASLARGSGIVALDFKCRSYLMHMVRLMVGAIVQVGSGKLSLADLTAIRETGRRPDAVRSAPAEGLCLMRVAYTAAEVEAALGEHPAPPSF